MKRFYFFIVIFLTSVSVYAQVGNALNFDGIDDYNNIPISSSPSVYTIEMWISPSVTTNAEVFVRTNASGPNSSWSHQLSVVNSKFVHYTFDGSENFVTGTTTISANTWYHVSIVAQNNSLMKLYVNGIEEGTAISIGTLWGSGDRYNIGIAGGGNPYFKGTIDEVRIWNVVRSQTDIQNNMSNTSLSAATPGLLAYYHFNQGTGGGNNAGITTLIDATSNNNDGTLNNFALSGSTSNWVVNTDPLPVELTSFAAKTNDDKVTLNWQTATEVDNYGFEIERASSSTTPVRTEWTKIGFVQGHGTSNIPHNYSFIDNNLLGGVKLYYRLKQIDIDGKFEYSDILSVSLKTSKKVELMQNSPNPFNPSTSIKFFIPNTSDVTIKIYDLSGREVATLIQEQSSAGFHIVFWNGRNSRGILASSGVYFYRLLAESKVGNFTETKKMMLLK